MQHERACRNVMMIIEALKGKINSNFSVFSTINLPSFSFLGKNMKSKNAVALGPYSEHAHRMYTVEKLILIVKSYIYNNSKAS